MNLQYVYRYLSCGYPRVGLNDSEEEAQQRISWKLRYVLLRFSCKEGALLNTGYLATFTPCSILYHHKYWCLNLKKFTLFSPNQKIETKVKNEGNPTYYEYFKSKYFSVCFCSIIWGWSSSSQSYPAIFMFAKIVRRTAFCSPRVVIGQGSSWICYLG